MKLKFLIVVAALTGISAMAQDTKKAGISEKVDALIL